MYHYRTAWRCAFFVGKKYGSKGYPQGNAAHMGAEGFNSGANGLIAGYIAICSELDTPEGLFPLYIPEHRCVFCCCKTEFNCNSLNLDYL
jgi:hypothetical protein